MKEPTHMSDVSDRAAYVAALETEAEYLGRLKTPKPARAAAVAAELAKYQPKPKRGTKPEKG
jgi:hypothetical protein